MGVVSQATQKSDIHKSSWISPLSQYPFDNWHKWVFWNGGRIPNWEETWAGPWGPKKPPKKTNMKLENEGKNDQSRENQVT